MEFCATGHAVVAMNTEQNVSVVPEKWESSFQVWMWTSWRSFYQGLDFPALATWLQGTGSVIVLYYWLVTSALICTLACIPQMTSLKENGTLPRASDIHGIKLKSLSTSCQPAFTILNALSNPHTWKVPQRGKDNWIKYWLTCIYISTYITLS